MTNLQAFLLAALMLTFGLLTAPLCFVALVYLLSHPSLAFVVIMVSLSVKFRHSLR